MAIQPSITNRILAAVPAFGKDAKFNTDKILTYYLEENEPLFLKAYYKELKAWIKGDDKISRERTLNYLNEVMKYTAGNR